MLIGLRPKQEIGGGVVYEFGKGTACFLYATENAGTFRARYTGHEGKNSIYSGEGAKAAWFKDSEGNILALIQDSGTEP